VRHAAFVHAPCEHKERGKVGDKRWAAGAQQIDEGERARNFPCRQQFVPAMGLVAPLAPPERFGAQHCVTAQMRQQLEFTFDPIGNKPAPDRVRQWPAAVELDDFAPAVGARRRPDQSALLGLDQSLPGHTRHGGHAVAPSLRTSAYR
jgi:hypothetical protein